jgi:hypothetical protein
MQVGLRVARDAQRTIVLGSYSQSTGKYCFWVVRTLEGIKLSARGHAFSMDIPSSTSCICFSLRTGVRFSCICEIFEIFSHHFRCVFDLTTTALPLPHSSPH